MKKVAKVVFVGFLALAVMGFAFSQGKPVEAKEVVIKAWAVGPDDPSITRAQNLVAAG